MGKEYELKYRATESVQKAVLDRYSGKTQQFSMETTYYDTQKGEISALRYTLRKRLENGRAVCTLKTPGKGLERGEWEVEADSPEKAISQLIQLGAPASIAAFISGGLIPTCGARFTRIARTLVFPHCTLELACDSGILLGGGKELPLCEIEVELKAGSTQAADAFGTQLQQEFHLEPEQDSKFCRAFRLYKGEYDG